MENEAYIVDNNIIKVTFLSVVLQYLQYNTNLRDSFVLPWKEESV